MQHILISPGTLQPQLQRKGAWDVHLDEEEKNLHCYLTLLVTGVAIPMGESSPMTSDGCSGPVQRHLMGDVSKAWTRDGDCSCPVQWHEDFSKACSSFPELCNALPESMLQSLQLLECKTPGRKQET